MRKIIVSIACLDELCGPYSITMQMIKTGSLVVALLFCSTAFAQTGVSKDEFRTEGKDSVDKTGSRVILSGMLISRFTQSFDKTVDVNGKYHAEDAGYSTSSFSLRRARLQARAQLTPKAAAVLLLNLTDFVGNPSNKVVENAFIKYRFNQYINLQLGQFRPYFGREDLYPEELLQTLEWSNQYYVFGANGWQSFQVGSTFFGKAEVFKIPVSYYLGVFNGNGRNQPMDNDNGKLFPARVELTVLPKTRLGLNGGIGKDGREKVWAYNLDIGHIETLGKKWELEIQSEYKRGNNHAQFDTAVESNKLMANYKILGYYLLTSLKYMVNGSQIRSVEFSCRYESLNCDLKRKGSTKQTLTPVAGVQFGGASFLRVEAGVIMDRYSLATNQEHNATRFVCQLKARF